VSVGMNRQDTTVYLERGTVIVEAAKRRRGHLNVASGETTASVTGTVFAVNRGMKGTRVSVLEGSVRVNQPARGRDLTAGDQVTSTEWLEAAPIRNEIAWSRNVDAHLKLLEHASAIAHQIESIRLPGMRYDSRVLKMLPSGTVVFAALPNLGDTLKEAHQIFEDRIRESAELRTWWEKTGGEKGRPAMGELVEFVRGAAEYLGNEVVLAVVQRPGADPAVGVLAEVQKQGLREYIDGQLQRMGAGGRPHMEIANGLVVFSPKADMLQAFLTPGTLAAEPFGQRIAEAYREGAHILFCADLSRLSGRHSVPPPIQSADLRYIVVEQRQRPDGVGQSQATVQFAGERHGIASWLAAPGPMGSLDYVSSGAIVAASFLVKRPDLIIDDLLGFGDTAHSGFHDEIRRVEAQLGVRFRDDIAASLGNEVTVALDGQLLPPAWKLVMEVKDPVRIQQVLERLIAEYNRTAKERKQPELIAKTNQLWGRTVHTLQFGEGGMEVNYAFSDGYLIAAADTDAMRRAFRTKDNGNKIRIARFLTADQYSNFSAVIYHDLSRVGMTITDALNAAGSLTPEQRAQAEKLAAQERPGLIYAYADNDRIRIASTGGFFGLTLENIFSSAGLSDLMKQATPFQGPAGFRRGPARGSLGAPRPPLAPAPPHSPDLSRDLRERLVNKSASESVRQSR
jgi:hypothetical protein